MLVNLTERVDREAQDQPQQNHQHAGQDGQGGRDNHNNQPRNTQLTKLKFPKFDGGDINSWLLKCETYFEFDHTAEEEKVRMTSIHLDDKTYQWHQAMVRHAHGRLPPWNDYASLLQDTFGEPFESPMGDFTHLRQIGSLREFHSSWDLCTAKLDLAEDYLLDAYLAALKPEIGGFVRMLNPRNVYDARRFA